MARVPDGLEPGELTVAARRVLLDCLVALAAHRDALVLVGAQAVYLRSTDAPVVAAPFTVDADLGLVPALLGSEPRLEDAMTAAGFERGSQPGIWTQLQTIGGVQAPVAVDLLVPERFGGSGRRAADIPPHDRTAARKVEGLEPAIIDREPMLVASLEPTRDERQVVLNVAGVAALLVAKAFKIADRLAQPRRGREADKDAGDVLRMMTVADIGAVRRHFIGLLQHPEVAETTSKGLALLRSQFGARRTPGTDMAVGALAGGALREAAIRQIAVSFVAELRGLD